MPTLSLETKTKEQEIIKAYLEQNASDLLTEKIQSGVRIQKDGKMLVSKKTLDGFMSYAADEAKKLSEQGAHSACVEDSVVFGWAMHYFDEDSIEGTLYNEDGSDYKPPKPAVKTKSAAPAATPVTPPKPKPTPQMSLFDILESQEKQNTSVSPVTVTAEPETSGYTDADIVPDTVGEPATESRREQETAPLGSPLYREYMALQSKYPDCIVVYRLGDFYEVFGDNAVSLSNELALTLTGRDCGLNERVPMVGFPYHAADTYIQKITLKHKIAVVDTIDDTVKMYPEPQQNVSAESIEPVSESARHWITATTYVDDDGVMHEVQPEKPDFDRKIVAVLHRLFGEQIIMR